jgi:hypothetical protein
LNHFQGKEKKTERRIRRAIDSGVYMAQNWKGKRSEDMYVMRGGGNRVGMS